MDIGMNTKLNISSWSNGITEWIDITDPGPDELKEFSGKYGLDYYALADCLEPAHLPKKETLENFTFLILRVYNDGAVNPSSIRQMSNKIAIFYNDRVVLTVHRVHAAIVAEIRDKFLETKQITEPSEIVTRIMYYAVKSYETGTEQLSDRIDRMEKLVFTGRQSRITLEQLYYLKNHCRLTRRIISLTREVIHQHVTTPADSAALQDVKDLLVKLMLSLDETHDDASNLSTIYLSIMSVKTNDVMKLLTIVSVFFLPPTFIVGIYGMNFTSMPELNWEYGYPTVLAVMLVISVFIFIWFKRKKVF